MATGSWEPFSRPSRTRPLVSEQSGRLVQISGAVSPTGRARDEQLARQLAWGGIAWHVVEFAIALAAGLAAGSIALVAFGIDSVIEAAAGLVVIWLFTGSRLGSHTAERRAQQLIAGVAVREGRQSWRGEECCDEC